MSAEYTNPAAKTKPFDPAGQLGTEEVIAAYRT
jgi:hypothetical protein